jgi:hypothetical protein
MAITRSMSAPVDEHSGDSSPAHATGNATSITRGQPQPTIVNLEAEVRAANATRTQQLNVLDEAETEASQPRTSGLDELASTRQQLHPDATRRSRSRSRHSDRSRSPRNKKRARSHYTRRVSFHQPQQLLSQSLGNYAPWSVYMKLALSDDVLWLDVLENVYTSQELEREGLMEADRVVRKHIMISVEMGEISAIAGARTANEMWSILRDKYESAVDPTTAKREFYGTTIQDSTPIKQHIDRMVILRSNMERSGTLVSEHEFLTTLKHSLLNPNRRLLRGDVKRSEHATVDKFTTYILSLDDEPIPPSKRTRDTAQSITNKPKPEPSSSAKIPESNCANCGRGNHLTEACRQEGGAQQRHCTGCGRYGHVVEKCWKRGGGDENDRSGVPKSLTQSAQIAAVSKPKDQEKELDPKAVMEELKQLREEMKRQNNQYGNSLYAESTRALMATPHPQVPVHPAQGERGISFVCDSGATSHMVNDASLFTSFVGCDVEVRTANEGSPLRATAIGTVHLQAADDHLHRTISLKRALYVPGLSSNLLSVRKLHVDGYRLSFDRNTVSLYEENDSISTGVIINELYVFLMCRPFHELASLSINSKPPPRKTTWDFLHRAAAHVNIKTIKSALSNGRVKSLEMSSDQPQDCVPCAISKMPAGKYTSRNTEYKSVGDLLCADLMFFDRPSVSGFLLAAVFIDVSSNYIWAYPLRRKDAGTILDIWKALVNFIQTRTTRTVRELQTDNGGEWVNALMSDYNKQKGITHRTTVPYAHAMNGKVERAIRTLSDGTRSNLQSVDSDSLWPSALHHLLHARNRLVESSTSASKSPYEIIYDRKPDVSYLLPFGQTVLALVHGEKRRKLSDKAVKGRVIGYVEDAMYRVLINSRDTIVTRDIRILNKDPLSPPFPSTQPSRTEVPIKRPHSPENESDKSSSSDIQETAPRRSSRTSKPSQRLIDSQQSHTSSLVPTLPTSTLYTESDTVTPFVSSILQEESCFSIGLDPFDTTAEYAKNVSPRLRDLLNGDDRDLVLEAIAQELSNFLDSGTFHVRERIRGERVIPGIFIISKKRSAEGGWRYKARWVVRGDMQRAGEFEDTFALAGDYASYRLLMALAASSTSSLSALDITSAFLAAKIDKPNIVVQLPTFFPTKGFTHPVGVLLKALYGLRQAPLLFHNHLRSCMIKVGYTNLICAPMLFYKQAEPPSRIEGGNLAKPTSPDILATFFVDDGEGVTMEDRMDNKVVGNRDKGGVDGTFVEDVRKHFPLKEKDLRQDTLILGMVVRWDPNQHSVKISVPARIEELARDLRLENSNSTTKTPMATDALKTLVYDSSPINLTFPYAKAVGSLIWIGTVVRPDIAFAIGVLSRFIAVPRDSHVAAVKRVVQYLLSTKNLGLKYRMTPGKPSIPISYSDSDWAGDLRDRKSVTGFVVVMNGAAISWRSRKQTVVAKSTAEAEYVAASACASEVLWFRNIFHEMNRPLEATELHVDNQAAMQMTENEVHHSRTKSIAIPVHHIRNQVDMRNIKLVRIAGTENPADILTKPLPTPAHRACCALLGLVE